MRRFFLLVAFVSFVSLAETNTVDLTEVENLLTSLETKLTSIDKQTSTIVGGNTLKSYVQSIRTFTTEIAHMLTRPDNGQHTGSILDYIYNTLVSSDSKLSDVLTSLSTIADDVSYNSQVLESCLTELESVSFLLGDVVSVLLRIENYVSSLPRIEAYQQSLALIVSNINNIVSDIGVTVNIPSSLNVNVQNFPDNIDFNPAWNWQLQYMYGTGEPPAWSLAWSHSDNASDYSTTPFLLFPDLHNDATFASWAGSLYKGLENGFESVSSSGIRSTLILSSISNINTQIFRLLAGMSPDTNFLASAEETQDAVSALRADKLTTESVSHEISLIDYTPNVYSESIPNIDVRPRLSGVVGAHDTLSETANFDLGISGFFQTATDFGYTDFEHPDSSISLDMRPVNDICIAVRQLMLMVFWMLTIALGAKLCLVVYSLYQTIWVSLMSSDSDIGAGQTVNTINFMRHVLP